MSEENNKTDKLKDESNEQKNASSGIEKDILVERVREIELAKIKIANSSQRNQDKNNTSKILKEHPELSIEMSETEARRNMSGRSRRSFLIGGATAMIGIFGWRYLSDERKEAIYRRAFEFNEKVSQTFYSPKQLATEFPREQARDLRINGGEGMSQGFDPIKWRLQVVGLSNPQTFPQYTDSISYETPSNNENEMKKTEERHKTRDAKEDPNVKEVSPATADSSTASQMQIPGLLLTIDDIKSLPRTEMTTELKCIEGWSVIVNWTGVRFSDFLQRYMPKTSNGSESDFSRPNEFMRYVSMITPDGGYYVGMDMPSMLHPQTLLAYEMNGAPLTMEYGAPLRLVTATKYGIKQIKRIGRITFTDERPADFWAERGYDWYAGH